MKSIMHILVSQFFVNNFKPTNPTNPLSPVVFMVVSTYMTHNRSTDAKKRPITQRVLMCSYHLIENGTVYT